MQDDFVMFEEDERFSKAHPLTAKIKDTDIFLHGTSSKNYAAIQITGLLKRSTYVKNYSLSQAGTICFEKYDRKLPMDDITSNHCWAACETDGCTQGVILKISGKNLRKLHCPIYADWNYGYGREYDSEGLPVDIDYDTVSSIVILDCDIPIKYLKAVRKVPVNTEE